MFPTTHARLGSIDGANGGRVIRQKFSQAGGASGKALGEPFKVGEVVVQMGCDTDMVPVSVVDAKLKGTKEAGASQDSRPYEA